MQYDFPIRKVIHVDMDAFYASVEQLDFPELKGKPVVVGGDRERGVIAAASYEARKYGVRSAMSSRKAKTLCPHLIFQPSRMERYKEISNHIRSIFYDYTDLVEPLSLDEAFLDVTENKRGLKSATHIAQEIRYRIHQELNLNASAGISVNKFLAKVASDINKPNGQKTIHPKEVLTFLETLPVSKFFGVGKVTAKKMHSLNLFKGFDLKAQPMSFLNLNFGKQGQHFYDIVRGIQHSQVQPDRIRKSVGAEHTYEMDITELSIIKLKLDLLADELERRMKKSKVKGRTLVLKLKYNDFTTQTRSKTGEEFWDSKAQFWPVLMHLLTKDELVKPIRLLGISFSNLDTEKLPSLEYKQLLLDLF